jgi:UDP-MurNAc hydroxylase
VGIFSDAGTSILCDPWITDGAFIGSWYHWPPLEGGEFEYLVARKWDAIYISHFHADHFDRKLLSAIAKQQEQIKVLIPKFANKWLRRAILNCGVSPNQVIEIESNQSQTVKDISVKMFTADYCNPQICSVSISCQTTPRKQTANDSLALFEADGHRILNANDALAVETAQKIWPLIGKVDLLLGHYGGAGPYPQCFVDLNSDEKSKASTDTGWAFVNRLIKTAEQLKARFTLPYAGQYVLGGNLVDLNSQRSVIPMQDVLLKIQESGVTQPISLKPFAEFDLSRESSGDKWSEPTSLELSKYLDRISVNLFPYQRKKETWYNGAEQLNKALLEVKRNFEEYLKAGGMGSKSSITIKSDELQGTLNFGTDSCSVSVAHEFENHTVIELDQRLLKRLVLRRSGYVGFTQYHFNQAEIGSHLAWRRRGPYNSETRFLNFMHCYLDN